MERTNRRWLVQEVGLVRFTAMSATSNYDVVVERGKGALHKTQRLPIFGGVVKETR